MPIVTDGAMLEPENKGIDQFHVGLGQQLAATAAETWADSPLSQLSGIAEMTRTRGDSIADTRAIDQPLADPLGNPLMTGPGPAIAEDVKPVLPRLSLADAEARVKSAGLEKQLKLPQQTDMPVGQLDLMISRARQRREWEATIDRGPDGFIPGALEVGTSFLVGAVDPINVASAFIPVMGELRYAKLLEGAATSAANRFAVRAAVGAAQGVVGQGLLEPLNWYAHTQDGRDFGMSDVLRDLMFGAVLGGGLQAGGGGIADVYRARTGKPLYPFAPGEPADATRPRLDATTPLESATRADPLAPRPLETDLAKVREAARNETHFGEPSESGFDPDELAAAYAEAFESHPPSASVLTIDDLPQRAREDAMRGGVASLVNGEPVRVGEMLESARQADPRIAESFDRAERIAAAPTATTVFGDVEGRLLATGMTADEARANAAIFAARYATRAQRLGLSSDAALDLYRGEGVDVRSGTFESAEGRMYAQRRGQQGPDLFAARKADGQQQLPGTERIGQGELAQRKADEALKPKVAQKPADEGLFSDQAAQKTLFQSGRPDIDWTHGGGMKTVKIGDTTIDYGVSRDGKSAEVILIATPPDKRRAGSARAAMQAMMDKADAEGATLFLNSAPMGDRAVGKRQLDAFYKSLGFVKNAGRNKDFSSRAEFVRQPQKTLFQSRPTAPTFFSAVGRAVDAAKQDKASPEQWFGILKNMPGVKQEEMEWLGLADWLKEQKGAVSRDQVRDYIRANQIEVKDVVHSTRTRDTTPPDATAIAEHQAEWDDLVAQMRPVNEAFLRREPGAEAERARLTAYMDELHDQMVEETHARLGPEERTKYGSYTLPGGQNYRELLLTLPSKDDAKSARMTELERKLQNSGDYDDHEVAAFRREYKRLADETRDSGTYRSSHWDEPNILAHVRFDDRTIDGKKVLHLAEVQSDWHQVGRKHGYAGNEAAEQRVLMQERDRFSSIAADADLAIRERYEAEFERRGLRNRPQHEKEAFWRPMHDEVQGDPTFRHAMDRITEINEKLKQPYGNLTVPDAPFKTSWPELALKRMIRYAAEHGYDRLSWDTGATSAERYDLSKRVSKIEAIKYSDGTYRLDATDNDGRHHSLGNEISAEKVADLVGKELAEKIVNNPQQKPNSPVGYSGLDLKVGGEGMIGFYDKILPAAANKLVKKFGAKVEDASLPSVDDVKIRPATDTGGGWEVYSARDGAILHRTNGREGAESFARDYGVAPVHAITITPELRKAAVEQGFPLFQGGDNPRGRITLAENKAIIDLFETADRSTFMHESGHLWLDELMRDAHRADAPESLRRDRDAVLSWLGVKSADDIGTAQHEKWASAFEQYLAQGEAPSVALREAFEKFKQWMLDIYRAITGSDQRVAPEIRDVMDRLLATDEQIAGQRAVREAANVPEGEIVTRTVQKGGPRGRAAADPQTWSLYEYLASHGGLKPDAELEAVFGQKRGPMIGGFGPLLRKAGLSLDDAVRAAQEGGYLPKDEGAATGGAGDTLGAQGRTSMGATPRDLLDKIAEEAAGRKQYRESFQPEAKGIDAAEEARHIVDALHDELEATTGQKGLRIDPALEERVVQIVQKEGERDVLAAYERAIMEDHDRYEGATVGRHEDETLHVPGWDAADAGPASGPGGEAARAGGRAGLPAEGARGADGGQPRGAGAGDRGPVQGALDRSAAWRDLATAKPDFDEPQVIATSQEAAKTPAVPTKLDERLAAAEKADAYAKQLYDMFAHRLPEDERQRLDDYIATLDADSDARKLTLQRGAACLFEAG